MGKWLFRCLFVFQETIEGEVRRSFAHLQLFVGFTKFGFAFPDGVSIPEVNPEAPWKYFYLELPGNPLWSYLIFIPDPTNKYLLAHLISQAYVSDFKAQWAFEGHVDDYEKEIDRLRLEGWDMTWHTEVESDYPGAGFSLHIHWFKKLH